MTSSYPANPSDASGPFFADLARELQALGHAVIVFAPDRSGTEKMTEGIEVHWIPWRSTGKALVQTNPLSPVDLWRVYGLIRAFEAELNRVLAREPFDAILAMWVVPAGFLARRAAGKAGVPYAVWALGSDINRFGRYPGLRAMIKQVLRGARWCFADGMDLAERVSVLGGVDCEFLPTARSLPPAREPLRLAGEVRFLYIGRLEPVKGIDVLVAAMRLIPAEAGASLYIRGDGGLRRALDAEIAAAGLEDRIFFVPPGPPELLTSYLEASHCLVIPSRSESIPVVLSEAVHAGTPVLVTDVGDMGRLARMFDLMAPVPPGDSKALAQAMRTFIDDQDEHRKRFDAARPRLQTLFGIGSIAERVEAVLSGAAALRPWRPGGAAPADVSGR